MSYPSGADTLFGGSALLVRLPLIWAFQPFIAFMLALAAGPAWLLARRIGLVRGVGGGSRAHGVLPALVYAYELLGSVKEITALSMILTLGALVVVHRSWLAQPAVRAIPFALVLAAGVSALGVAFGAWALAPVAVLAVVLLGDLRAQRRAAGATLALIMVGALAVLAGRVADVGRCVGLAARRAEHRLDGQRRQPARAASCGPGARRVAARQLQALAGGDGADRDRRPDRDRDRIALRSARCSCVRIPCVRARRRGWR